MKIEVKRTYFTDLSTIGILSINGEFLCYTLEDVVREVEGEPVSSWKVFGETAIPRGTYRITITHSNHFNADLPLLIGVDGYDGVRIHPGNAPKDTEGCILVGTVKFKDSIGNSRIAFQQVFMKIKKALDDSEEVTLTIG